MYEIVTGTQVGTDLSVATAATSFTGFTAELLKAIPMALAEPLLSYQRTKAQRELIAIAINAKTRERSEILRTMQELAKLGQLTPELSNQLLMLYLQQPVL